MRPRVFPAEDRHVPERPIDRGPASMRPRVFPAEDASPGVGRRCRAESFNEAAGIPRGRRRSRRPGAGRLHASMRPRVFPAEDRRVSPLRAGASQASMRPRVFPAEDYRVYWRQTRAAQQASMRPRVFPAEDISFRAVSGFARSRFNEAAGIPRGRLQESPAAAPLADDASMRPRVFPAEDAPREDSVPAATTASMRPRVFPAEDDCHCGGDLCVCQLQ